MRVHNENGSWNQEALQIMFSILPQLQEIYNTLEAAGLNFREASILLHSAVLDEELLRALDTKYCPVEE